MTKLSEVLSLIEKCSYHGRATPVLEMYLVILQFNSVEQISIVNRVVAMAKRFLTRGPL